MMVDARLESDTALGFVVRQEADLCPCKEFCCSCEVGRPETESQTLRIQADSDSADAVKVEDRCEKLLEVLGLNSASVGDLTAEKLKQLQDLIKANHDVFALDDTELGCTGVVKHTVDTEDHIPIKQPARRLPFVHRELSNMMDDLLNRGIIQPSSSMVKSSGLSTKEGW